MASNAALAAKVDEWLSHCTETMRGCWEWQRSVTDDGYARPRFAGPRGTLHRMTWLYFRGDIPAGLVLDHLCRNTRCCNPWHLDPVTSAVNVRRGRNHEREKTHCPQGHAYSGSNLRIVKNNKRQCRTCDRDRKRASRA